MKKERALRNVNEKDYLTVEETAEVLGVKSNAIRNYLYLGKFTTHKFKTLTLIDAHEVEGWKDRQRD